MKHYTHTPAGEEVRAAAGYYVIEEEKRFSFRGREVFLARGNMAVDSSCCGTGGCGFVVVPGFVVRWKFFTNEKGEAVSEVEPVRDAETRDALRKIILESETVQQVNFW